MARAEGVGDIGQGEGDAVGFAGLEGHRLFEALAEFAAEWLAADQLLIAAHGRDAAAGGASGRGRAARAL